MTEAPKPGALPDVSWFNAYGDPFDWQQNDASLVCLLGAAPREAAEAAGKVAIASFGEPGAIERTVHLSFGDTPAEEYAWQLVADHVVHTWDLAAATGGETGLDAGLVAACATWWRSWEDTYRGAGAVADRVAVPPDAGPQDRLIASFGRDPRWT